METKIIKTPIDKTEVVLKEWITGKEKRDINGPMTDIKMKLNTLGQGNAEINIGEARKKVIENSIKVIVLSVGGKKEGVVDLVDNMKSPDYDFVMSEVDKIISGENFNQPSKKQDEITS